MHNRYSVLDEEDVKRRLWLGCGKVHMKKSQSVTSQHMAFINIELLPSCDLPEIIPTPIFFEMCTYIGECTNWAFATYDTIRVYLLIDTTERM